MNELWRVALSCQKLARDIGSANGYGALLIYDQPSDSLSVLVYGSFGSMPVVMSEILRADEPVELLDGRLVKAMVDAGAHFDVVARLTMGMAV